MWAKLLFQGRHYRGREAHHNVRRAQHLCRWGDHVWLQAADWGRQDPVPLWRESVQRISQLIWGSKSGACQDLVPLQKRRSLHGAHISWWYRASTARVGWHRYLSFWSTCDESLFSREGCGREQTFVASIHICIYCFHRRFLILEMDHDVYWARLGD